MDEQTRLERVREASKLNQIELAKRKYERKKQKLEALKKLEPKPEEKVKKRACLIQLTVIDENGEYSHTWNAPALMGTVLPTKRNKADYMAMAHPLLQRIYGKLV